MSRDLRNNVRESHERQKLYLGKIDVDVETLFRQKQEQIKDLENKGNELTAYALRFLESKYTKVPTCHLRIIFSRFIKARWHFWTEKTDEDELAMAHFQKEIEAEANSSKTSKRMVSVN